MRPIAFGVLALAAACAQPTGTFSDEIARAYVKELSPRSIAIVAGDRCPGVAVSVETRLNPQGQAINALARTYRRADIQASIDGMSNEDFRRMMRAESEGYFRANRIADSDAAFCRHALQAVISNSGIGRHLIPG